MITTIPIVFLWLYGSDTYSLSSNIMTTTSPQTNKTITLGIAIAALGVVYGDIGTSPLYALRICFMGPSAIATSPQNVLGVLSLIFWSLIVLVSFKYLSFVLRADNRGEGGILALMTLLAHKGKNPVLKRGLIVVLGLFGASLLYGDGLITPVISVLSALEGLTTVTPGFDIYVVPLSLAVLVLLFWFQKRGTAVIGAVFGPVMLLWFSVMAVLGIFSIVHTPYVLLAMDPRNAVLFFVTNRLHGFFTLGSVFLVLTGGEALYADMGHFGKRAIRAGWFSLVLPSLLLNYFGQGAYLLRSPSGVDNLFYRIAPSWTLLPLVALATMATVIASQAVISGVFSLARQSVQLGFWPRLSIIYTSNTTIGQVYVPAFNGFLCVGTILLVLAFLKSDNLAGAYGVAVSTTMLITTLMLFLVMHRLWRWNLFAAAGITAVFLVFDISFFLANIMKIRDGGWISLAIAAGTYFLMATWDNGRAMLRRRIADAALSMKDFLADVAAISPIRVPATSVFLAGNPSGVPRTLLHNYKHNLILHNRVIILTVVTEEIPHVDDEERSDIVAVGSGFYWCTLHYGFSETPDVPKALSKIDVGGVKFDPMKTTYFLGRETLIVSQKKSSMARWQKSVFSFLSRNACDASKFFCIPTNRVIEIGIQVDL
jgi:KUP system potassium uptake protein